MKQFACVALILAVCLVGCSSQVVIANLQLAVDAAETAFPIIAQQANLPPAIVAQIDGYLQSVNTAIVQAAPILASTEPTAQKVSQISAIFASVAMPQLPPGTPQVVASAVAAVARAVAQFLASASPKSLATSGRPVAPSKGDLAKLAKIVQKAQMNLSKLK